MLPAVAAPLAAREQWLEAYRNFCSTTFLRYQEVLFIRRLPVDTYELWLAVQTQGGSAAVTAGKLWAATARRFNHPPSWTNASHAFKSAWDSSGLGVFEAHLEAAGNASVPELLEEQQEQQLEVHQQQQQQQEAGMLRQDDASQGELHARQPQLFADELLEGLAAAMPAAFTQAAQDQQSSGIGSAPLLPAVGTSPEAPLLLHVRCGSGSSSIYGVLDVHNERAYCHCAACVALLGPKGCLMTPTEFERHGGCGVAKKWKKSLQVVDTGRNVGQWLKAHGLLPPPKPAAPKKQQKLKRQASRQGIQAAPAAAAGAAQLAQPLPAAWPGGGGGGPALQHLPGMPLPLVPQPGAGGWQGPELVGRLIWVWWPLDGAWYEALVAGFQEPEALHTLQYGDSGEVEVCNLLEEVWMHAPPPSLLAAAQHSAATWHAAAGASPAAVAPTAAAPPLYQPPAGWLCELPPPATAAAAGGPQWQEEDDDGESAWLAAAQASMVARPLRVVYNASAGAMRVLLAADLLAAEHEARMQLREQQYAMAAATAAAAAAASGHGPPPQQYAAGSWHGGGGSAAGSQQGGAVSWQAVPPAPLAHQPSSLACMQLHANGGGGADLAAAWAPSAGWPATSQQVTAWEQQQQQQQQHDAVMAAVLRAKRAFEPAADGGDADEPPSKRSRPTPLEQQLQAQLVID